MGCASSQPEASHHSRDVSRRSDHSFKRISNEKLAAATHCEYLHTAADAAKYETRYSWAFKADVTQITCIYEFVRKACSQCGRGLRIGGAVQESKQ